jgi:hypothetical protein
MEHDILYDAWADGSVVVASWTRNRAVVNSLVRRGFLEEFTPEPTTGADAGRVRTRHYRLTPEVRNNIVLILAGRA